MKRVLREAARLVVGSFIVYVIFAACSAGGARKHRITAEDGSRDGDPPPSGQGGSPPSGGGVGGVVTGGGSITDPIVDPVPVANAEPTDGSRLKAMYRVAQDGAREPVANLWWDSERGEECTWRKAADGVQRCLPTALAPSSGAMFADSGCTQDAIVVARSYCEGQTLPPYTVAVVIECTSELRSRLLQVTTAAPSVYNRNAEGACVDLTTSYAPTFVFYRATEVPASAFVAATLEHD